MDTSLKSRRTKLKSTLKPRL